MDTWHDRDSVSDLIGDRWLDLGGGDVVNWEDIARYSARAYPAYIVADKGLWQEIQEDGEANLALSAEEIRVLESALFGVPSTDVERDEGLPLFINGRAGSGKSTLLYHIFSHYISRKIKMGDKCKGDILFLTYSRYLLDIAEKSVDKLLQVSPDLANPSQEITERSFQTFRDFLLDLLPQDERRRYQDDKFINFSRFRRLYLGETSPSEANIGFHHHKPVSPDLAWHVIRVYIKGFNEIDYFDLNKY